MNHARLNHTLQLLDNPSPNFSMSNWGCCAFGHEVKSDYAEEQGLRMEVTRNSAFFGSYSEPFYKGGYGFVAAAKYYDISSSAALWLFDPASYPNYGARPSEVQQRIREVIAGYEPVWAEQPILLHPVEVTEALHDTFVELRVAVERFVFTIQESRIDDAPQAKVERGVSVFAAILPSNAGSAAVSQHPYLRSILAPPKVEENEPELVS